MKGKELDIIPVSGKTNVAIVYEQLEQRIRDGFWNEDDKLPSEFVLCEKFNVGRSTIREALNILKAREFVYTVPGLGTFVNKCGGLDAAILSSYVPNPKSKKDLLNIMEFRLSLEPMNAALAARRATKTQLWALEKQHEVLLDHDDPGPFATADMAFHMLLTEANGNPMYQNAMNLVQTFLLKQQFLTTQEKGRRHGAVRFHSQILTAIRNRDESAAEEIMREHMDDTFIYMKSIINKSASRVKGKILARHAEFQHKTPGTN